MLLVAMLFTCSLATEAKKPKKVKITFSEIYSDDRKATMHPLCSNAPEHASYYFKNDLDSALEFPDLDFTSFKSVNSDYTYSAKKADYVCNFRTKVQSGGPLTINKGIHCYMMVPFNVTMFMDVINKKSGETEHTIKLKGDAFTVLDKENFKFYILNGEHSDYLFFPIPAAMYEDTKKKKLDRMLGGLDNTRYGVGKVDIQNRLDALIEGHTFETPKEANLRYDKFEDLIEKDAREWAELCLAPRAKKIMQMMYFSNAMNHFQMLRLDSKKNEVEIPGLNDKLDQLQKLLQDWGQDQTKTDGLKAMADELKASADTATDKNLRHLYETDAALAYIAAGEYDTAMPMVKSSVREEEGSLFKSLFSDNSKHIAATLRDLITYFREANGLKVNEKEFPADQVYDFGSDSFVKGYESEMSTEALGKFYSCYRKTETPEQ